MARKRTTNAGRGRRRRGYLCHAFGGVAVGEEHLGREDFDLLRVVSLEEVGESLHELVDQVEGLSRIHPIAARDSVRRRRFDALGVAQHLLTLARELDSQPDVDLPVLMLRVHAGGDLFGREVVNQQRPTGCLQLNLS